MAIVEGITGELREAMERAGFKMGTAYMEVPRCETCRWWKPLPPEDATSGTCTLASRVGRRKMLAIEPGSGVLTAPDFGCIQWGPKE